MATRKAHRTTLVGPSKAEPCPGGCGDQIAWVLYIPVLHRRRPGQLLHRIPLDLPAIASGAAQIPVPALRELGVSHVTTASLLQCELLDDDRGMFTNEYGHTIHHATHPDCSAALTTPGSTR